MTFDPVTSLRGGSIFDRLHIHGSRLARAFLEGILLVHLKSDVDLRVAMQIHTILLVNVHVDREHQRENVSHHGDGHGGVGVDAGL